MLILKRCVGQSFWMTGELQAIVLSQCSGNIRVGIEAPSEYHFGLHEITFEGASEKHE